MILSMFYFVKGDNLQNLKCIGCFHYGVV